ncbi:glycosyltransferase [Priestia megaterium]
MKITFVCRGMREGGGIQRVIDEIARKVIDNYDNVNLTIISDNFSDYMTNEKGINTVKIPSSAGVTKAMKAPRYLHVLLAQPIFLVLATLYIMFNRKQLGTVYNHGAGQCLVQDIVIFHSCHHAWVTTKRKTGKKVDKIIAYLSPFDWFIMACEKINTIKNRKQKIVAVSDYTKGQLSKYLKVSKSSVINNGVDVARFRKNADSKLRLKYNLTAEDKVILFVANEWKRKGLENVFATLENLQNEIKNIKLLIAGRNLNNAVHNFKEKYNLSNEVIFLGEQKKIEELYAVSDVLCVPSEEDAFGLVFAEAMSSEVPTIVTDKCGMAKYIEHGVNGFLISTDDVSKNLFINLKDILSGNLNNSLIGLNGRNTVINNLSWEEITSQYVKVALERNIIPIVSDVK